MESSSPKGSGVSVWGRIRERKEESHIGQSLAADRTTADSWRRETNVETWCAVRAPPPHMCGTDMTPTIEPRGQLRKHKQGTDM